MRFRRGGFTKNGLRDVLKVYLAAPLFCEVLKLVIVLYVGLGGAQNTKCIRYHQCQKVNNGGYVLFIVQSERA